MARGPITRRDTFPGPPTAEPAPNPSLAVPLIDLPPQTALQDAIHERHQNARDRILQVFAASEIEALQKQAFRMAGCGSYVDFEIDSDNQTVRRLTHACKSRFCPFCQRRRSQRLATKIERLIRLMKHPRTIVLTVKSMDLDLKAQYRQLAKWFRKLRIHPDVRPHIINGVYTREATVNTRTGLFHPHLHIIYDGDYLAQKRLRYIWHSITKGSDIVWIQDVHDPIKMARELATYVIKPADSDSWLDSTLQQFAAAVHGMQMLHTFGKKFPPEPVAEKPDELKRQKLPTFSLTQLAWQASRDVAPAAAMLVAIAARWPDLGRYIYHQFPQLHPDPETPRGPTSETHRHVNGRGPPRGPPAAVPDRQKLEVEILRQAKALTAAKVAKELQKCAPKQAPKTGRLFPVYREAS